MCCAMRRHSHVDRVDQVRNPSLVLQYTSKADMLAVHLHLHVTASRVRQATSPVDTLRRYISFVYYGFGLLVHAEYQGREILSCVDPALLSNPGAATVQVSSRRCSAVLARAPTYVLTIDSLTCGYLKCKNAVEAT